MALWPFRRKSSRKRSRSGAALSDGEGPPVSEPPHGAVTRAVSKKKQRTEPAKLQRRPRTYSFSPGRHDSIRVDRSRGSRQVARQNGGAAGAGSQDLVRQRMPTLYHRNNQHPARRKSSKRRREDHEREAEIKAMSASMPTRAATDACATGSLGKRSSKRVKTTGLSGQWEKPASNVSLPLLDSIHSSQSSDSDFVSYRVSMLDSLAPRPTLRYATGAGAGAGARCTPSRASALTRSGSQKRAFGGREAISQDFMDSRKRIDDLADALDAGDLREVMERDNRRRQRRRQCDQEHMERKLARRAEKQRRESAEARESGTPPPENLERGVLGRELVGLGIEPPSAVVTSSKKRDSPSPDAMSDIQEVRSREPLEVFHAPTDATSQQRDAAVVEESVASRVYIVPPADPEKPVSLSSPQGSIFAGILRSKKSQSKSTLSSDKDKAIAETDASHPKDSRGGTKNRRSLTSFLKWRSKNRHNPAPSSFSNMSREEMQAAATAQAEALTRLQGDDVAPQANYLTSKLTAGTPKRTQSRFREDLPDYPLSPPDSRVQSPEAESPLPMVAEVKTPVTESRPTSSARHDTSLCGTRSMEAGRPRPLSVERVYGAVSPDPQHSMSLASIDSEGSWLSGRVGSRRRSAMRDSLARANRREQALSDSPISSNQEDVVITDDDYLSRLAAERGPSGVATTGRRSGDGRPSSDEEDAMQEGDVRWGAVGARAQVVNFHGHDRHTMRSHVGLLNMDLGDEEDVEAAPVSPVSMEGVSLQRARSVHVGPANARNFKPGQVKLLDNDPEAVDR